jgi:DNA-binding MarR family transcriptional regulator
VQRLADVLVDNGDATYQANPRHRRADLLAITPAGLASLQVIQHAQRTWSSRLGEELGKADLDRAKEVLDRALHIVSRDLPTLPTHPGTNGKRGRRSAPPDA